MSPGQNQSAEGWRWIDGDWVYFNEEGLESNPPVPPRTTMGLNATSPMGLDASAGDMGLR